MKTVIANKEINSKNVRLVPENQVMDLQTAIREAENKGLDLVQLNEADGIPVVKIMDLKKHLYDMKQLDKENRKKNKATQSKTKEIKMCSNIQENDLNVKMRKVTEFLNKGYQVRIELQDKTRTKSKESSTEQFNTMVMPYLKMSDFVQEPKFYNGAISCIVKLKK